MGPRIGVASASVLVQIIHLAWDKSARGGEGARRRNSVPLACAIAEENLDRLAGEIYAEELHWGSSNSFIAPVLSRHRRVCLEEGFTFGSISVSAEEDGLALRFRSERDRGRPPVRWFRDASGNTVPAGRDLIVRTGEWVRMRYNGRFSCIDSGTWWYEQVTVNLALFGDRPHGGVFVEEEPAREYRRLAILR